MSGQDFPPPQPPRRKKLVLRKIAVDGVSGKSPYIEQYSIYNFVSAPVMGGKVVLTSIDMIKF